MRFIPIFVAALSLTACELIDQQRAGGPVDVANLPPLSSREQALIYGADGAVQQHNYVAAERDYLDAIAESKGRIEAHLALARLYEKQGMVEKERAVLESALALQPKHPLANYRLGKLYLDRNHYDRALVAFQNGRSFSPDDIDLTIGEAVTQDMLGKHGEAQRLYVRLLNDHPRTKLTIVRTNLAMSYLLSDAPQKAVDLLKEEAGRPDASSVTKHNLALAYGLLGRNGDAKAVLDGEIDEETRQLAVARMRAYHRDRIAEVSTPPLHPMITEVPAPVEPPISAPVVVIDKGKDKPVPAVKPAPVKAAITVKDEDRVPVIEEAAPKPKAEAVPTPSPKPVVVAPKVQVIQELEPAAGEPDPNYIPGLTDVEDEDPPASAGVPVMAD